MHAVCSDILMVYYDINCKLIKFKSLVVFLLWVIFNSQNMRARQCFKGVVCNDVSITGARIHEMDNSDKFAFDFTYTEYLKTN